MFTITRSFVLLLWTQTFVFVKCQDCTLDQFLKSNIYDANFETSALAATYGPGKQVRVPCKIGFTGFFKLICTEGKWEPRGSICEIKSCGHPGDTPFGDYSLQKKDDFVYGSQVMYTCQRGYHMVSRSNIRRCQAEGWDGVVPICEAIRCPSTPLPSGVQVVGDLEEATFSNVVKFSCRSSDQVLKGSPEMYCQENGEWRGTVPECIDIKCDAPVIEHGRVERIKEYKKDELLNFHCDPGFKKADDRSPKCLKLGQQAEWAPKPACKEISCELSLPPLMGTTYNTRSKSVFLPGETVRVTCGERYWIIGTKTTEEVVTCKVDGEWTIRPVCREVTCSDYLPNENLSWSTTGYTGGRNRLDDTVWYNCARNYDKPTGTGYATCTRDGWTPKPLCRARSTPCPRPEFENADITRGLKNTYDRNDQVHYRCKTGNQDYFTATCKEGTWTGSESCASTSAPCPSPEFENADITDGAQYRYNNNDQVRYRCQTGNREPFTATCKEGTWTESKRCTVCTKPPIGHGFALGPFNNTVIYYSCNENYKLAAKSWWAEATCVDGKWSDLHPCIAQTQCGEAPVIPNGRVTRRDPPGGPARLEIVCNEGYRTETSHLTCLKGEWNLEGIKPETLCKPASKLCEPPPKVENAVINGPYKKEYVSSSSVTYQCRTNYTINGGDTIRCNEGAWEKKTKISCVRYCAILEDWKLTIMSDVKERYMEGENITYKCNAPGAVISGSASCVSGTWSKSTECPALPCTVGDLPMGLRISGKPPTNNQVAAGQTLRFFCPDEHHLEGAAEIECLEIGDWKESLPTCSKKCEILALPDNVVISEPAGGRYLRSKGEILTFGCLQGLSVTGHKTIQCLNNGEWSGQPPTCERRSGCGSPPPLTDGDTVGFPSAQYEDGATVAYICFDKYILKGVSFKTCDRGVWTGEMRCMKPCTVNAEMMNRHNIAFARGYENKLYAPHEDHLTFVCKYGTSLVNREPMRKQCIDGQMALPTCG